MASTVVKPQRLVMTAVYEVRMLRTGQLKLAWVAGAGAAGAGAARGWKALWKSLLRRISYNTAMSKPRFQAEWEEIDEEYQQLQVTENS